MNWLADPPRAYEGTEVIAAAVMELTDAALASEVVDGLGLVEDGLRAAAEATHDVLAEASAHLTEAGGKRFRPTLVLLAAQFGDPSDPRIVPAAVAVELTHLATLYHDDVMDEAVVRRGSASANSRWGNTVAILTGDFLFARASQILADLGPEAIRIQAETFSRLVTGQIAETVGCRPGTDPLRALPQRRHREDCLADRDGGAVRGAVLRRARQRHRQDHAGLRSPRRCVPAVRRHSGRGQRILPIGQDAGHRPA